MDTFAGSAFEFSEARLVPVDVYSANYHVKGLLRTRLSRVAEILNQLGGTHLSLDEAIVIEHGDTTPQAAQHVFVPLGEILVMIADESHAQARDEMRIPKRPVRVELALPPFRVKGTMYVARGSTAVDGLLMGSDRFLPVTDAAVTSLLHPELAREAPALAIERERAQLIIVEEDEQPEELLAEIIDERTAASWLRPEAAPEAAEPGA